MISMTYDRRRETARFVWRNIPFAFAVFGLRRRPNATAASHPSSRVRRPDRGRATVRAAQPASFLKQLAGEQGQGGTQDGAGPAASFKDTDDAGSVHAGGQR